MAMGLPTSTGQAPARPLGHGVSLRSGFARAEPPGHPKAPWPTLSVKTPVTPRFSCRRSPLCLPCPTEGKGAAVASSGWGRARFY